MIRGGRSRKVDDHVAWQDLKPSLYKAIKKAVRGIIQTLAGGSVIVAYEPQNYTTSGVTLEDHLAGIDAALGLQSVATAEAAEVIDLSLQAVVWHLEQITGCEAPDFEGPTELVDTIVFYLEHITGEQAP